MAALLSIGVPLIWLAFCMWLAAHWASGSNPALWRKAAYLERGDAAYWHRIGLYAEWQVKQDGVNQPIEYLKRATQIEPRSAEYWMDLADAYTEAGDVTEAKYAFSRAQADYPYSAELAWRYGNFLLYEGQLARAYEPIRRALMIQPTLAASAISECWQANPDAGPLLDYVLPAQTVFYASAMDFFLSRTLLDPAQAVWNRERALHPPLSMPQALPFVNALIAANRLAEAESAWNQALNASKWPPDYSNRSSPVFNGGFEHKIVNGGFGWRIIPADGVRYTRDTGVAHSGSRSLRVDFLGHANLDFRNVFQLIPVQPSVHYHFSAYLRTEAISTDQGLRFEIFDPQHRAEPQILTPDMIGTNSWTPVTTDFTTRKNTRLIEVALRRVVSWKLGSRIRGSVWIDDVALTPDGSNLPQVRK